MNRKANTKIAEALSGPIARREVFIWAMHGTERLQMQVDAVSVCMNGDFIQIQLDPKYKIVEA